MISGQEEEEEKPPYKKRKRKRNSCTAELYSRNIQRLTIALCGYAEINEMNFFSEIAYN